MKTNERKNDARNVQSFKKTRRLLSAAAVLLVFCLVLTAPVGAADNWIGSANVDWYNSNYQQSYTISSAGQLAGLAKLVNEGNSFDGKIITLTADIDLAENEWTPIGTYVDGFNSDKPFKGTFDGGGHTISNLLVTGEYKCAGLFGYVVGGTISNLKLTGAVTNTKEYSPSEVDTVSFTGGLAGYVINGGMIDDISASMSVKGNGKVGGIVGNVELQQNTKAKISQCTFIGEVSYTDKTDSSTDVGGIAGSLTDVELTNCQVFAELTSNGNAGGIAGFVDKSKISYCITTGTLCCSVNGYVGGCVGTAQDSSDTISYCIVLNENIVADNGYFVKASKSVFGNIFIGITISNCKLWTGMEFTAPNEEETKFSEIYASEFWKNAEFWTDFTSSDDSVWEFNNDAFPIPTLTDHQKPNVEDIAYLEPKYSVVYDVDGTGMSIKEGEEAPKTEYVKYAKGESVSIADPSSVLIAGYPATQWYVNIKDIEDHNSNEESEESEEEFYEKEDKIYTENSDPIFVIGKNTVKRKNEYADKDITVEEEEITFHPAWEAEVTFAHDFDDNEGWCTDDSRFIDLYGISFNEDLPHSDKEDSEGVPEGFTFVGWGQAADEDDDNKKVEQLVVSKDGSLQNDISPYTDAEGQWIYGQSVTFYPFYATNSYTLAFDANGGTGFMESQVQTYDTSKKITLPKNTFTRDGYRFAGWAETNNAASAKYTGDKKIPHFAVSTAGAAVTLYAVWEPVKYGCSVSITDSDGKVFSAEEIGAIFQIVSPNTDSGQTGGITSENGCNWFTNPESEYTIHITPDGTIYNVPSHSQFAVTPVNADENDWAPFHCEKTVDENGDVIFKLSLILDKVNGEMPTPDEPDTPGSTGVPESPSSGSATDTGSGNYSEYPRSTDNGGEVGFGTSPVVIKVILPEGTTGSVTLLTNPDTPDTGDNDVYYDFELDVPNYPEGGEGKVIWRIPQSILDDEFGADDYGVSVFDGDEWKPLASVWEEVGNYLHYTTEIAGDGNFIIVKEKGISEKAETDAPVVVPGDEPQDTPGETLPPSSGDDKPDEKEEEPKIPVLGLGIGLLILILVIAGIVFAVSRRK